MNDIQKSTLLPAGIGFVGLSIVSYLYSPSRLNRLYGADVVKLEKQFRIDDTNIWKTIKKTEDKSLSRSLRNFDNLTRYAREFDGLYAAFKKDHPNLLKKMIKLQKFLDKKSTVYMINYAIILKSAFVFFYQCSIHQKLTLSSLHPHPALRRLWHTGGGGE